MSEISKSMEQAIAEAEAEQLRDDNRVERVEMDSNYRGVLLRVIPTDRLARDDLQRELHDWTTWIEVEEP